jgi:isovaleryl-CoA dehydrogenase
MRTFSYRVLARCSSADRAQAGRGELHSLSAAALLHAAESASRVVDEAVQIHGGLGCMRETEVNRLYRAAKIQEIGAGTKEIRRLIIARELLAE